MAWWWLLVAAGGGAVVVAVPMFFWGVEEYFRGRRSGREEGYLDGRRDERAGRRTQASSSGRAVR